MINFKLMYFKDNGKYYAEGKYSTTKENMTDILKEINEKKDKEELEGVAHPGEYTIVVLPEDTEYDKIYPVTINPKIEKLKHNLEELKGITADAIAYVKCLYIDYEFDPESYRMSLGSLKTEEVLAGLDLELRQILLTNMDLTDEDIEYILDGEALVEDDDIIGIIENDSK